MGVLREVKVNEFHKFSLVKRKKRQECVEVAGSNEDGRLGFPAHPPVSEVSENEGKKSVLVIFKLSCHIRFDAFFLNQ